MSWNYQTSLDRIQNHLKTLSEIQVEKLVRDADLYALLSETNCRDIFGAHVYIDVSNFSKLASEIEVEEYRRIIQAIHRYHREVARIVETEELFDGVRIHFQGPKLHALFFRPIDSSQDLANKAVLLQIVLRHFVASVFNPAFPFVTNIAITGGADLGRAIGTKNGVRGDRELLFLGSPANHAAKILGKPGQLNLTARVFAALHADLQGVCTKVSEDKYQVGEVDGSTVRKLVKQFKLGWDSDASAARLDDEKRQFPLKNIEYSEAETSIDLDSLSITSNKRVRAASLFADVSGFTAYIDAAQSDQDKKTALRVFHAIRKELAAVVKQDFGGLRIQYQGDRVQALFHLPKDDDGAMATKAVETAAGLQSSMEYTLRSQLPESDSLGLAIGIDLDVTLVSKIGPRGKRDRICIGSGVENAARTQEKSNQKEVSVTPLTYELLDSTVQRQFTFDKNRNLYVAKDFYADRFERLARAAVYSAGGPVSVHTSKKSVMVDHREGVGGYQVSPSKSYAE